MVVLLIAGFLVQYSYRWLFVDEEHRWSARFWSWRSIEIANAAS